tara:strand:- start:912 stop:1754 length:843 start_codon:yes stop_codon:yes gene_type:complete
MELFKYLSDNRLRVLGNGLIRFTQPNSLNDPFELKPELLSFADAPYTQESIERQYLEIFRGVYESLPSERKKLLSFKQVEASIDKDHLFKSVTATMGNQTGQVKSELHRILGSSIGVLSLSETPHNLLMWSHYANDHKGYVIGFDSEHEYFEQRRSEQDQLRCLRKVRYSKDMPVVDLTDIKSIDELMIKGIDWSYEQEWRMLQDLTESVMEKGSESDPVHLFKIPFDAFMSVRIGAKVDLDVKRVLLDLLNNNLDLKHLKVYEMSVHRSKFELVESRIK